MSLLSIAQDVTDAIGLTRPAAIIAGNDQLSRQILSLAKDTLEELGGMDWPVLEIPYTFNTVVNQAGYVLPADFDSQIGDTLYNGLQYGNLRGSLTPSDWMRQKSGLQVNMGRYRFRIFGLPSLLNLQPMPSIVEALTLEYKTKYRVVQADTTYKTTFFADTDVTLMPEELLKQGLKWRLRHAKGLDYSEEFNAYEMLRGQRLAQALTLGSMPVAQRTGADDSISSPYIPETGFGH